MNEANSESPAKPDLVHWYNYLTDPSHFMFEREATLTGLLFSSNSSGASVLDNYDQSPGELDICCYRWPSFNSHRVSIYDWGPSGSIDGIPEDEIEKRITSYENADKAVRFFHRYVRSDYPIMKWTALFYYGKIMRAVDALGDSARDLVTESYPGDKFLGLRMMTGVFNVGLINRLQAPRVSQESLTAVCLKVNELKGLIATARSKISSLSSLHNALNILDELLAREAPGLNLELQLAAELPEEQIEIDAELSLSDTSMHQS